MAAPGEESLQQRPVFYGDQRVVSDPRKGCCLFWVVPDVAPGFNVPAFYEDFVNDRRAQVQQQISRRAARAPPPPPPPPPPHGPVAVGVPVG